MYQGVLVNQLKYIFPNKQTFVNARSQANLQNPLTGSLLEFDVWIPELNLGFEFQDSHHYVTTWYSHKSKKKIQDQDRVKQSKAQQKGITLVIVPCWWDTKAESLEATIHFHRPDLNLVILGNSHEPISLNPSFWFFQDKVIPDVGELMLASLPVEKFEISTSSAKWWIGEKYDGIRSCWNPRRKQLYSRFGRVIKLLPKISSTFPRIFLDGECWFGRGLYLQSFYLIQQSDFINWENMRLVVFDNPAVKFQLKTFEKRYRRLLMHIQRNHPLSIVASRMLCENDKHLAEMIKCIIEEGGEGIILRKLGSIYEHGRTTSLIKLKTYDAEKEGLVSAVGPNNSIQLRLPEAKEISVPAQNVHIPIPEIGSVVTFTFERNSRRDTLVNPIITRLRKDLGWDDVLKTHVRDKRVEGFKIRSRNKPPTETMSYAKIESRKEFFEKYARDNSFDPQIADNWYTQPCELIMAEKGASNVIGYHNNSLSQALVDLFPDIGLDTSKLWNSDLWKEVKIRRKFFEIFARTQEFNPLHPQSWYRLPIHLVMQFPGIYEVIRHHQNSICKALCELFPELGLVESQFDFKKNWEDNNKRKEFFVKFAYENGFDPLVQTDWYMQPKSKLVAIQDIFGVISFHNNSVEQAIVDLFPNVGLSNAKFWAKDIWCDKKNRRRFFEHYAKANEFDPEDKEAWYSIPLDNILSTEGIFEILPYHKNSVSHALVDLFPNIGLDKTKLLQLSWQDNTKRREFFLSFAKENGIDPNNLEHWSLSIENLRSKKALPHLLTFHKGSIAQALRDLFPQLALQNIQEWNEFFWREERNRLNFFMDFAEDNEFDPYNVEMWTSQRLLDIQARKGASDVFSFHKNNVVQGLVDLFSGFEIYKAKLWRNYYDCLENRRKVLEEFSRKRGFDPLNAQGWYQYKDYITSQKDFAKVIAYHGGDLKLTLVDLFPEIDFENSKLFGKQEWHKEETRRLFFVNYAKTNGFDPLIPFNWYSHPRANIMATKGASRVIHYHNDSVVQSLIELFPNMTFNKSLFSTRFYKEL